MSSRTRYETGPGFDSSFIFPTSCALDMHHIIHTFIQISLWDWKPHLIVGLDKGVQDKKAQNLWNHVPYPDCHTQLDFSPIIVVYVLNKINLKLNWKHDVQSPNLMNLSGFSNPPKLVSIEPCHKFFKFGLRHGRLLDYENKLCRYIFLV